MFRALRKCYTPVRARNALLRQHWKKMNSSSTEKIPSSWHPRAYSSKRDGNWLEFKHSVRLFDHVEGSGLRIQIIDKKSFTGAMGIRKTTQPPPSSLTDLYLDRIGPHQIPYFNPVEYPDISDAACSFLIKLSIVAKFNVQAGYIPREEMYIDNMATDIMKAIKCDDGRRLTMSPYLLRLTLGNKEFKAKVDKDVRRGTDILLVVHGNKHDADERTGDIRLASCMIAAYQENAQKKDETYPERMMGIKIRGNEFYFYSMRMATSYRNQLFGGAPNEDIEVFKYPGKTGLSISVPEERKLILNHLWSMRCYAAKLKKSKAAAMEERYFTPVENGLRVSTC